MNREIRISAIIGTCISVVFEVFAYFMGWSRSIFEIVVSLLLTIVLVYFVRGMVSPPKTVDRSQDSDQEDQGNVHNT